MNATKHTEERPPIVVVMGHVDHGKSTLLDFIRKSNTVAKEAGGITQHVAAYEVEREKEGQKRRITFIDTPGHAAFAAIRARGANVADIAILVVAADDGVKAQTLEALQQIRDAKIPFVVAINKIDKPNADLNRTQASLMEKEVYLEKLGGDVPWAAISAKTGAGVEGLLDLILIVAELHELKGSPSADAEGYVIEAHRDQKRGLAATLVIRNGHLRGGMAVLAGRAIAPVRILEATTGKTLRDATFSTPVQLVGFDELPRVGEAFKAYKNKKEAEAARPKPEAPVNRAPQAAPEDEEGHFAMPVIVRADTTGSLEAITHEVVTIGDEKDYVSIVQSGIGTISESDVKAALAGRNPAVVIGFNVGVDEVAKEFARQHGLRIELFDIIYKLTERLAELLKETRPRREVEQVFGRAKVLKQFSSRKDLHVIGGKVAEGYLQRGTSVRALRRGVVVGVGKIQNMQANKQDVNRVETGGEFGAQVESAFEIMEGDSLECFSVTMA
ncbi:MAG: translation initiation factor IF-2 [Candidatus Kaiserbacteria bacterium]|nr:MAG: translation initiation factor IF-2 [Candidatus Kaiserbacteria bacterium]